MNTPTRKDFPMRFAPLALALAAAGLLAAAIDYLIARAQKIRVYGGVGIRTEDDWTRIFETIDAMIDGALAPRTRGRKKS